MVPKRMMLMTMMMEKKKMRMTVMVRVVWRRCF